MTVARSLAQMYGLSLSKSLVGVFGRSNSIGVYDLEGDRMLGVAAVDLLDFFDVATVAALSLQVEADSPRLTAQDGVIERVFGRIARILAGFGDDFL